MVDLEQILALDNAHVREKEAEMLAALMEFTGPARQQIDGARRGLGGGVPPEFLTLFVSEGNRAAARQTVKFCTSSLFDVYAETAFAHVIDAEPFIALLPLIGERVRLKLQVIDKDEVEVRRHKWESAAWAREKPTLRRRLFKWLLTILDEPAEKAAPGPVDSKAQGLADGAEAKSGGAAARETPPDAPTTVGNGGQATAIDVGQRAKSESPEPAPAFGNRASWLATRLLERGWSTSAPSQWGGPDRKTIDKILRGEPVGNPVLQKLAEALSKQVRKVDVLDIPKN